MNKQVNLKSIKFSNDVLLGSVVEMVDKGSVVKINISGTSMKPFLYDGDSILLAKVLISEIKIGDIILGKYKGNYVLHRVIRRKLDRIFLVGDNNLSQIEEIELQDIYAKATCLVCESGNKDLTKLYSRLLGILWYYLRPLRKIYFKLFKIRRNYEIKK